MRRLFFVTCLFAMPFVVQAQLRNNDVYEMPQMSHSAERDVIAIPGFDGYQTLKCDFHVHTTFSDGTVWPSTRVAEAWQDGLDAIAITEHLEYRPYSDILKGDHNESYRIAAEAGKNIGFIVIHGAEVTRGKPFGHMNALFLKDANLMDVKDPLEAIDAAKKQGAFIMWNHPGWPDDKSTLYPVHEKMIKEGKIDGVEVFNDLEFYPVSFDWCNRYKLAFMGNSDIHGIVEGSFGHAPSLRPMTLVFATERSEAGVREALFAGRSMALFGGTLAGPEAYAAKLVKSCLKVTRVNDKYMEVENVSSIPFRLKHDKRLFYVQPRKVVRMPIPESDAYEVENCYIASDKKLIISLTTSTADSHE